MYALGFVRVNKRTWLCQSEQTHSPSVILSKLSYDTSLRREAEVNVHFTPPNIRR